MTRHGLKLNKWVLIKEDTELGPILIQRSNGNQKDRWRYKVFGASRAELEAAAQHANAAAEHSAAAARAARQAGSPPKPKSTAPQRLQFQFHGQGQPAKIGTGFDLALHENRG